MYRHPHCPEAVLSSAGQAAHGEAIQEQSDRDARSAAVMDERCVPAPARRSRLSSAIIRILAGSRARRHADSSGTAPDRDVEWALRMMS